MRRAVLVIALALLTLVPDAGLIGGAQAVRVISTDWVVDEEEVAEGVIVLDGDLLVRDGGRLVLAGATLRVKGDEPMQRQVRVEPGGTLVVTAGGSVEAFSPTAPYGFVVEGRLEARGTPAAPVVLRDAGGDYPRGGLNVAPHGDGLVLEDVRIRSTGAPGLHVGSHNNVTVTDTVIEDTGGVGVELAGRLNGVFERNRIVAGQRGLEARSEQGNMTFRDNEVRAGVWGVVAMGARNLTITGGVVEGGERAVLARMGATVRVERATLEGYGAAGATFMEAAAGEVVDTRLRGGGGESFGVHVADGSNVTIRGATVRGHGSHGIVCAASQVTIQETRLAANGGWGALLHECPAHLADNAFGTGGDANGEGRVLMRTRARVAVADGDARPVAGARVTATDALGASLFEGTTDATGRTPWFEVVTYRDVDGDAEVRNPVAFTAARDGLSAAARYALQAPQEVVLTLAHLPDLRLGALTLAPAAPAPGDNVTITASVENGGKNPTNASEVVVLVNNTRHGPFTVPPLEPGGRHAVRVNWTAAPGGHVVVARADPGGVVEESDETNNMRRVAVRVASPRAPDDGAGNGTDAPPPAGNASDDGGAAAPNLRLASLRADVGEEGAREGRPVDVVVTVENAGSGDAGGFRVALVDNGVRAWGEHVEGLAAGERVTLHASLTLPAGERLIEARVDAGPGVAEANGSDNGERLRIAVAPHEEPPMKPPTGPGGGRESPGPSAAVAVAALALAWSVAVRRKRNA